MKFLLLIVLLFSLESSAQWIPINKSVIEKSRTLAYFTFQDSLFLDGSIHTERIHFFWDSIQLNKQKFELRLKGRVCAFLDTNNRCAIGISSANIFTGKRVDRVLRDSTRVFQIISNNEVPGEGYFDFTIKLNKNKNLYFYTPEYYVDEYSLRKIMKVLGLLRS